MNIQFLRHFQKIANTLLSPSKIILVIFVVVTCGAFAYLSYTKGNTHTIVLTDDGFVPAELTIQAGDTVTFTNKRETPFWPAADVHPTHSSYPEFDTKEPLEAGTSWQFTFTQQGTWNYHDHIDPLFEGTIFVEGRDVSNAKASATYDLENCKTFTNDRESISCWDDAIKVAYDAGGLAGAFDLYEVLYRSEPVFAKDCHSFTHTVGYKAFDEYLETNDFGVTDQVAYCSYGFFHGFMEALVHFNGDYAGARDFCDIVDRKIGTQTNVYTACLHGIGHGVTDGYDPTKTDALSIVEPGLDLCRGIGQDWYEVKICATGVFNSLAGLYESGKVAFDREDPLAICYNFASEKSIQSACFDDMKTVLSYLTDHNFVEASKFIETIEDDELAIAAIDNLATYRVYWLLKDGFESGVEDCYKMQERLQAGCVRGISVGFMVQGDPGTEHVDAINVCRSTLVEDRHREECFDRTMVFAQERYPKEKHASLCESIRDVYQGDGCLSYRGQPL